MQSGGGERAVIWKCTRQFGGFRAPASASATDSPVLFDAKQPELGRNLNFTRPFQALTHLQAIWHFSSHNNIIDVPCSLPGCRHYNWRGSSWARAVRRPKHRRPHAQSGPLRELKYQPNVLPLMFDGASWNLEKINSQAGARESQVRAKNPRKPAPPIWLNLVGINTSTGCVHSRTGRGLQFESARAHASGAHVDSTLSISRQRQRPVIVILV